MKQTFIHIPIYAFIKFAEKHNISLQRIQIVKVVYGMFGSTSSKLDQGKIEFEMECKEHIVEAPHVPSQSTAN